MVINSFIFWLVYPFLFLFYWVIPSKNAVLRKWYLIIVSYLIYMSFNPSFTLVLLYVTSITFGAAICIENADKKKRKKLLPLFLIASFAPLFLLKYLRFFADAFSDLLALFHIQFQINGLNWIIPIGISFYTLQTVAYVVEVYYDKTKAERNFSDYMLFVSFFPHIVCGPISFASELLPQIKHPKPFNYDLATRGLKRILWGMFLKLVIADRAGLFVDSVYRDFMLYSGGDCIVASIIYSIQIYADFAGYSMMAIGIANTLGYQLVDNFRRPYFAVTVGDIWKRWHISLSRWLKYNIYIPLGGSRCSKLRNYINLLLTFTVSGLWHGANWTYVFWGLTHGIALVVEKMLGIHKFGDLKMPVRLFRIFITFNIVNFSRIFFRMPTISDSFELLGHMVKDGLSPMTLTDETNLLYFLIALPILIFVDTWEEFFKGKSRLENNTYVKWAFAVFLVLCILTVGVLDSGQFIYAKF